MLGIEVGGRWADEGADFVWGLAKARARATPELVRKGAAHAYYRRWTGLLAFAAANAFAASLLDEPLHAAADVDGEAPHLDAVFAELRGEAGG